MSSNTTDPIVEEGRYKTEFKEIEQIGRGGFSRVFKAQHNMITNFYAIKKIFIR